MALVAMTFAAVAAEPAGVGVELNRLEAVETNCRATLVVRNDGAAAYDELKLDLVIFDRESIVAKRLIVDLAPLPAKKTTVKSFDIGDLACDSIGQLLLNEVTACGAGECLALVTPSSRAKTPFIK